MNTFALAHASHTDWETAVDDCLSQLADTTGANTGFLYLGDIFVSHLDDILKRLRDKTGASHWTGSLSVAPIANATAYFEKPAIVVMLAQFPEHAMHKLPPVRIDVDDDIDAGTQQWIETNHPYMAIVHGDPHNPRIPRLLGELSEHLGGAFLAGGLTSSRNINYQLNDEFIDQCLSGLLFSPEVPVLSALTQGCSPIGPVHTVTAVERNIISRIDDRGALDVFKEDIGEILSRDLERVGGYIFVGIPVAGSDTMDYTIRNLVGIDPENELLAVGDMMMEGDQLMFCKRDTQTAIDDMQRMLDRLKQMLGNKTIRGGLYFTCLGRGPNMFGDEHTELAMIHDTLGEFPLTGFYANGEISHDRLYGFTGVLTLFTD
jgi:small ligand-binding sensory domain FIST